MENLQHPELSIFVVAYNSSKHIIDCIGSIYRHTKQTEFEILLIDNGPDGTQDLVAREFPTVRIVPSKGNIGFGAGNNRLAEAARGAAFLMLNPDTRLDDPAIDQLMAFRQSHPQASAWGGRTRTLDGELDAGNFMVLPTLGKLARLTFGLYEPHPRGTLPPDATAPGAVPALPGAFMLFDRTTWERLQGFDESFFLYSEEIDLFARLRAAGGETWVAPHIGVTHDVGSGDIRSPYRTWLKTVGQMHYMRKHWSGLAVLCGGLLIWIGALLRYVASMLVNAKSEKSQANRKAFGPIVRNPAGWWYGYSSGSKPT